MSIYLVGLNAKTHTVEEREKYALLNQQIVNRNNALIEDGLVSEIVTLSTCNRVEHYFVTELAVESVTNKLFNCDIPKDLYILENSEASHHLFRVVSGLDSEIVGENEILGQVKKAYFLAQENDLTAKQLNVLFQKAISVGKRVRTVTDISKCSVSTDGIILDKIKKRYRQLSEITVLLIGAGDISRSIAMSLHKKGVRNILISNRSQERGTLLAQEMESVYIPLDELHNTLSLADVIISSTSAPHYIITKDHESFINNDDKILVDLAVPRDIAPEVEDMNNITLINIDNISTLSCLNKAKRENEVNKAHQVLAMENCKLCMTLNLKEKSCITSSEIFDFNQLYKTLKKTAKY